MNATRREQYKELKTRIEPLRVRVEAWRKNKTNHEKMPEALWAEATALARLHGVSSVQGILRIDYRGLERRARGSLQPAVKAQAPAAGPPRFVELPSLAVRRPEHLLELEDGTGRKLSLRVAAGHLAEALPLAQAFWRPGV